MSRVKMWFVAASLLGCSHLACCTQRGPGPTTSPARIAAWKASRVGADRRSAVWARYARDRERLERRRVALAARDDRTAARGEARQVLDRAIGDELIPAWIGTPWAFEGTSTRPLRGHIACGFFVSTVAAHAGLKVERDHLARQASALIASTFGRRRWTRHRSRAAVATDVRARGEGLYVLGLDTHVGLLRVRGRAVDFCHATGRWPGTVLCEPAARSPSLRSVNHVVAPLLSDAVVDAWLDGAAIPTARPAPR